jgi:hypothetical protein
MSDAERPADTAGLPGGDEPGGGVRGSTSATGRMEPPFKPGEAVARVRAILAQLEELEPRLAAASSGEVEMTLLERATELVEEAGRLLERLGRLAE